MIREREASAAFCCLRCLFLESEIQLSKNASAILWDYKKTHFALWRMRIDTDFAKDMVECISRETKLTTLSEVLA